VGDFSDSRSVDRLMRCPAGIARLNAIREALQGRVITDIRFSNETNSMGVHLRLDNVNEMLVFLPELRLAALLEDRTLATQEHRLYIEETKRDQK